MKKAILLSMIAVTGSMMIVTGAKAQKGFYVGTQGAGQVNIMFNKTDADKPGSDYKSTFGTSFGVSGGYNFTNHFGVATEVNYSKLKQHYSDNTTHFTQKFNYLKVPVLFTYNTDPARKFIFTAKAGPQLGILMNSKISAASDPKMNGSVMGNYNKFTLGAMVGTGVRMRVADHLYVDAGLRADGSITNTEKKNHVAYGRSSSHDISLGLELGMKYFF